MIQLYYIVKFTIYSVQCTVHNVQCTIYITLLDYTLSSSTIDCKSVSQTQKMTTILTNMYVHWKYVVHGTAHGSMVHSKLGDTVQSKLAQESGGTQLRKNS